MRVYIEHNVRLWDFGCYVVVLGFLNADGCGRDLPRAGVVKKKKLTETFIEVKMLFPSMSSGVVLLILIAMDIGPVFILVERCRVMICQ